MELLDIMRLIFSRLSSRFAAILFIVLPVSAAAGPWLAPGDLALRHDIQLLADAGVITAPVTSWPLSWGGLLNDIADYQDSASLEPHVNDALVRVRRIGFNQTKRNSILSGIDVNYDTEPNLIRGFEDRARETTDVAVSAGWLGDRIAGEIVVNGVSSSDDDQDVRLDGSYVGFAVGNFMLSAGVMERYWGPAYDGSIILGNNHRPIPAFAIDRNDTAAFKTKWLSWIGPWDASFVWGQLENDRVVPNARFMGLRVNFRPLKSLEIGLSRTAQWCGNGDRPCDLDTVVKIAIGRDNIGDDGIDSSTEPGNQLAGIDVRWSPAFAPLNGALYAQFIGEDEAGGFPSRYLGQIGFEVSGYIHSASYRAFAEFSGTACQFYETSSRPNCGYNNDIYRTGYRYKGRSIGHGADNDAETLTVGALIAESDGDVWQATLRSFDLNNQGAPDVANTVSSVPAKLDSIEVSYRRSLQVGEIEIGAGLSRFEDVTSSETDSDTRLFINWRAPF